MSTFFSPSVAARLHAVDVRTHSAIANAPCILGVFLTVFAVFPLEPIADTLVVIYFVHWQTLAVVLKGPVSIGCLKRICTMVLVSKSMHLLDNEEKWPDLKGLLGRTR